MEKEKADKLIVKYSSKVYGFAVKKTFSYDEAEELSGEMLKELYLSMLHAEDIVNPEGYVWRICEHVYAKYVNQKKLQKGVSLEGFDLPYFDEHDFGETEAQIKKLRKEIGFLSASRREIVYSFYYEGKSIVQIAKEQGLPEGTVKWHLNKARNDLKEGFTMERKIGSLGISPVTALDFSHWGRPGTNGGPEYYLGDKICLNIVYSVYENPKTVAEIAEDLGMTPVYLEDKIEFLVANGFLVETKGKRYTTYVRFSPRQFSLEAEDNVFKMQQKAAKLLSEFAKYALEQAMVAVKQYPPQLQDFVIVDFMQQFIGNRVALMVMNELYESGTFRPLTKQEKVTANLLMFSDTLPE